MEDFTDGLAESIQNELKEIITVPAVRMNDNVLRVPEYIKKLNPAAYEPRLISIGPMFRGRSELQLMEAFKKRYAQNFIDKCNVRMEALICITKNIEQRLREAYGMESSEISSHELVKIMIIDGAFLVEFLSRHRNNTYEEIDRMTHKKWKTLTCDLLLLENQIPFHYLDRLFYIMPESISGVGLNEMLHMFIHETVLPQFAVGGRHLRRRNDVYNVTHFLDSFRRTMDFRTGKKRRSKTLSSASCPTISQLQRAGIKFRPSSISPWSEDDRIYFRHGVLELPPFVIDENTVRYVSNVLVLELSQEKDCYATDYIALMDYLIDGPEDVKILVENGILQNFLNDDRAATDLINEIGRASDVRPDFSYSELVGRLNAYCKKFWNKWKSNYLFEWKRDLKRNYFNNPWTTLSVIAAVILLGLTVTQTVCSILQLNQGQ